MHSELLVALNKLHLGPGPLPVLVSGCNVTVMQLRPVDHPKGITENIPVPYIDKTAKFKHPVAFMIRCLNDVAEGKLQGQLPNNGHEKHLPSEGSG